MARTLCRSLGAETETVTGAAATERQMLAALPGRRVIHLATHGFYAPADVCGERAAAPGAGDVVQLRPNQPLSAAGQTVGADPLTLSGIVLAGADRAAAAARHAGPEDDGILTARDIAGLDLNGTEVVVLSACHSGRGLAVRGEGALGLGYAFLMAGAQATVVSLWSVPSRETSRLFEAFYSPLFPADRGPARPAAALRAAQLAVVADARARGESTSGFTWGAFGSTGIGVTAPSAAALER